MPENSFTKRLGMGLRYAFGGGKAVANILPTWETMNPRYSSVNFETMVTSGYRKNELIYACIAKTANSASQVGMRVRKKRSKAIVEDHPLKRLIQAPNPYMSEFDFWSAVIIYQKLAGRAYFEKERDRLGRVIRLWPLRPDWVKVKPSVQTMIGGYEYCVPSMDPIPLRVEDVLDFKLFDPLDRYGAYAPVAVAARVGDVDNSVTDFLKLFFEKGGVPPGLLKTKQKLVDAQVADIRRRWRERYGGVEKWIEPAVLDSDAEYQKTGLDFQEMGFEILDARNEARICMVLDVPPILVGANVGLARATYSNYREARKAWWEDSLSPVYVNFMDVIENGLAPEFGGNITCDWDFSRVAAFQEEMNERWARATDAVRTGVITVNQFCAEVGLEDAGPAGEVYLRSLATVEVPAKTGVRPVVSGQAEVGSGQEEEGSEEEESEKYSVFSIQNTEANSIQYTEKGVGRPEDEAERRKAERALTRVMGSYFDGQLGRVEKELRKNGR